MSRKFIATLMAVSAYYHEEHLIREKRFTSQKWGHKFDRNAEFVLLGNY